MADAALRAGRSGDETAAWCAREGAAAGTHRRVHGQETAGAAVNAAPRGAVERSS